MISVLILSFAVHAQLIEKNLKTPVPKDTLASPMASMKKFENAKNWAQCSKAGKKAFANAKDAQGWVALSWLKCSRNFLEEFEEPQFLEKALATIRPRADLFATGAWKTLLNQELIKSNFALVDLLIESKNKRVWTYIDSLTELSDRLDKDSKSKLYFAAGEISFLDKKYKAAQQFLSSSLAEKENKPARDRLNQVLVALDIKDEKPSATPTADFLSEKEQSFDERLQVSLKSKELLAFVQDGVAYLNEFPNGRRAKFVNERILEIYQTILDKIVAGNDLERFSSLRDKALAIMKKGDLVRVNEWARYMHKKGDFLGSMILSEHVLAESPKSQTSASMLYVAGRSAQFLGNYKIAHKYFEEFVAGHSGSEELNEVMFRLALTHIREEQHSSAIAVLERLLLQKNIDRFELSARYWLVRSLQASKNPRADTEAETILQRYPFSYYGIRLKAEKDKDIFTWPVPPKETLAGDSNFYMTAAQDKLFQRIEALATNGWYAEAQSEISNLALPREANLKALLARKWVSTRAFPLIIRLVNEAGDMDPALRSTELIRISYPHIFAERIDQEAKAQKLSPYLVRSLIRQESAFGTAAVSTSNALGLMQLIPPTAQEVAQDLRIGKLEMPDDLFEPDTNIRMGTYYLSRMIKQFDGCVPMGLAAYNAGPYRMQIFVKARPELEKDKRFTSNPFYEIWFDELPWAETSFYVKAILRNSLIYKALDKGRVSTSGVLWSDLVVTSTEVTGRQKESKDARQL